MAGLIQPRLVEVRVGPMGLPGFVWRAPLHVRFEVDRGKNKSPNKGKVELFNLAPQSLALLEQPDLVVMLLAGETFPSLLFVGDLDPGSVSTSRQGVDQITTLEAADGRIAYRDRKVATSYPGPIVSSIILLDVVLSLGLVLGYVAPTLMPKTFPTGWAFMGRARDALDELVDAMGGTWSIQDGILELNDPRLPQAGAAVVISQATGMRGAPERISSGVKASTKLNPGLRPGRIVSVVSRAVSGFYRCDRVTHVGESSGLVWESHVEGSPL